MDGHEILLTALEQMSTSSDIQVQREKFVIVTAGVEKLLEDNVANRAFLQAVLPNGI